MDWKKIADYLEMKYRKSGGQEGALRELQDFLTAREAVRQAELRHTEAYLNSRSIASEINAYLDSLGIRHNDTDPR